MPKDRQFVGLNAYKELLQTDCDMVILATPPGFRPLHFEAAVKAGKQIFAEKPVAVDAAGVRKFLAANEEAKKKDLAVAIGLQRRHERKYMETVKAIQDGAIGDIVLARAYWNGRKPWFKTRQDGQTEMEYQMRNWYNFIWLCGDHIVEQHIHNLDVINWIKNDYPATAQGQGGCVAPRKGFRRDLRPSHGRVHLRRRHRDAQPVPPSAQHLAIRLRARPRHQGPVPTSAARRFTTPTAR